MEKLLKLPQVIACVGLQKTALYERIKRGAFPRPVKIGNANVWRERDIAAWIDRQFEQVAA